MEEFNIDIIIPVYNEGKNIENVLDSLTQQTKTINSNFRINII